MLTPFDHAFAILLVVLFPVLGSTIGYRRLKRADPSERLRLRLVQYHRAIAIQWLLATTLLASWVLLQRPWWAAPAGLGVMPLLTYGLGGVALGTVIVLIYVIRVRSKVLDDPEGLAEVRERLGHVEPMMPRTRDEFRGFVALSITAGICEELLYRGFLIWYFTHFVGLIPAAVVASLVFGIGHSYQGLRGMLTTAAAGAFLSAVYLVSGSLAMPMLLHALMDLHSGHLGYVAFARYDEDQAQAARESAAAAQAEAERRATAEAEAGGFVPDPAGDEGRVGSIPGALGPRPSQPARPEGDDVASA